jgi:hypothetical protein
MSLYPVDFIPVNQNNNNFLVILLSAAGLIAALFLFLSVLRFVKRRVEGKRLEILGEQRKLSILKSLAGSLSSVDDAEVETAITL